MALRVAPVPPVNLVAPVSPYVEDDGFLSAFGPEQQGAPPLATCGVRHGLVWIRIRKPSGLHHTSDVTGMLAVAHFFATKNFAVKSKTLVKDLALRATDAEFQEGTGPEIRGPLLFLIMVMAGRPAPRTSPISPATESPN